MLTPNLTVRMLVFVCYPKNFRALYLEMIFIYSYTFQRTKVYRVGYKIFPSETKTRKKATYILDGQNWYVFFSKASNFSQRILQSNSHTDVKKRYWRQILLFGKLTSNIFFSTFISSSNGHLARSLPETLGFTQQHQPNFFPLVYKLLSKFRPEVPWITPRITRALPRLKTDDKVLLMTLLRRYKRNFF